MDILALSLTLNSPKKKRHCGQSFSPRFPLRGPFLLFGEMTTPLCMLTDSGQAVDGACRRSEARL